MILYLFNITKQIGYFATKRQEVVMALKFINPAADCLFVAL